MRLIALLMLIPFLAYGEVKSKIGADTVTVGVPSSGNNITFKYQDTTMATRANKATGKLQFTNDSVAWKDFGSGDGAGGSGVNIISNPSYEDAVSIGWTNSGGTFTQETYSNNDGINTKYARFVASGSGQYFRTTALIIPTPLTGACIAYIGKYSTSNNNVFIARVLDSSFNIIASQAIATSNGAWTGGDTSSVLIPFPCPSAGQTRYFDVVSTGAGTIDTDLMYFGSENRLVKVQPNGLVLDAYFAGNTGCSVSATSSSSWVDFGTAAGCLGLTINYSAGGVTASTTDIDRIDRITVSNLKAGKYKVTLQSQYNNSTTANFAGYRITDGTQNGQGSGGGASNSDNSIFYNYFDYSTDQSSVTFKVQCYAVSPSTGCAMRNDIPTLSQSKWIIERVDSNADLAISQSQSEWLIDVNIGGANIGLSNAVTSYTEVTNSSLDLVPNPKTNSAPVKIPCSGTNTAGYPSCSSGNEGVGVVFNPPYVGKFKVCMEFTATSISSLASSQSQYYQLVLTQNNSQTILDEGGSRTGLAWSNDTSGNTTKSTQVNTCGIFNFSDTSEKTIRLMYESAGSASVISIEADRASFQGQRDIHVTVVPLKNGITPMKTGNTVSSSDDIYLFGGYVNTSNGVVTNRYGDVVMPSSCSASTGVATCTLSTTLKQPAVCNFSTTVLNDDSSAPYTCSVNSASFETSGSISFITKSGASRSGAVCRVQCTGVK